MHRFKCLAAAAIAVCISSAALAAPVNTTATYAGPDTTSESWTVGANWSSTPDWPSGIGAGAIFNNPTADRSVNVTPTTGEVQLTVGSIQFNNATAFNITINGGTTTNLIFDAVDAGPATVTVTGNSTSNGAPNTISARTAFNDTVVASVEPNSNTSVTGDLNWTGAVIASPGGFTKQGDGILTFGTNAKLYTGPTVLDTNGGRTRMSVAGSPTATSSFTIKAAQLTLITGLPPAAASTYTFGPGSLNLNGTGLGATSPIGNFPGAIRNDTNVVTTITNNVVLQTDSLIHVQGSATGSTTLSGNVSGPGQLALTAPNSDANLGKLVLTGGSNTYAGGTLIRGGTFEVGSGSSLGTGNVTVTSGNAMFAGATAKLLALDAGVLNAIADNAVLSLAGGGAAGVADDGFLNIVSGSETVGGLVLGGVNQTTPGTYGATGSGAANINDEYFAGGGVVNLVLAATVDADFDNDLDVDGNDFLIWQRNLAASGKNNSTGDTNNDGAVNATDLTNWKAKYGLPVAVAAVGAVPEPATALLALAAAGLALAAGRRR